MMGRPVIQATLALLLNLALSHISNGGANTSEQIEFPKQSDEIHASIMEKPEFRVAREAGRKSHPRREEGNQNKKKSDKRRKKLGQAKRNKRKNRKKLRQIRKNRMKPKKNGKKNNKQLRKNNKKEKRARNKENRSRKVKKDSRRNKKKSRQKKKQSQSKKKSKTNRMKSVRQKSKKNELSKWEPKQACDETALCQKIKDYIKISNQLRKVRRIVKSCETMEKKANKSASEFEATAAALDYAIGSCSERPLYKYRWRRAVDSRDDVTNIKDKLENCSISAKAKCQKSSVAPCQEEAILTKCDTELDGWLKKFGPTKGSCLQASSDCCACITALPDVSKECLAFDKKSTIAVASRKKCTNSGEQGSFGFCRKLQVEAAEKGPQHAKDNCKPSGGITTKGPIDSAKRCLVPDWWNTCVNTGSTCKGTHNWNGTNFIGYCCKASSIDHNCCVPNKEECIAKNETSSESGEAIRQFGLPLMTCNKCFSYCDLGASSFALHVCKLIPGGRFTTRLRDLCYSVVATFTRCRCKRAICVPGNSRPPPPFNPVFSGTCPPVN